MQQGRVSTIRFNEWICVCAQYEKAVARIGRQVYQGYSRGLLTDFAAIEMCKEISQAFADSKQIRADMEEELERDALHGLSVEESKAAEEVMDLTPTAKITRNLKLKATKLMGRGAVNRSLQSYRDRVVELSRDLGLRALAMVDKEPLLKMEGHKRLCQLALKLDEDSNRKWEEITRGKDDKGGMNLSFHTMLISFIANFANFSRGTAIGKALLKIMKYDSKEEEKKLTKQYEGSKTADALVAQMAEVEEPDPDIGREMATMERDYVETPTDWGLPPKAASESWIPDTSDNWMPQADAPAPKPAAAPPKPAQVEAAKPPATPADGPKPQVLRQRRQPEPMTGAEAWVAGGGEDVDNWAPPPPPAPTARIGQNPMKAPAEPEEDWASEKDEEDDFPAAPGPRLGQPPALKAPSASLDTNMPPMPPKPAPRPVAPPETFPAAPVAARPAAPTSPPAASSPDMPLPPLPPLPARPIRSLDIPAASAIPKPAAPKPAAPKSDDPLLRLLRPEASPEPKNDDDLLPAFLRERNDDDSLDSASSFIPDLPDSVDSGLKIIPFGSQTKAEESADKFIPKMPDQ